LLAALKQIPDRRKARGKRHALTTVLAVAACGVLAGMRGYRSVAQFAQDLPTEALRRLGVRPQEGTGQWRAPSEPTIRRVLSGLDTEAFEQVLGTFQSRLGSRRAVAIDGKTLRGSGREGHKPQHLLAAVDHESKAVIAQQEVGEKTNEIPKVREMLKPLDVRGAVLTLDAMHANAETATVIVEDKTSEYLLTIKDNQKTIRRLLSARDWSLFPPLHGD
jgi:DDE_Tnp_1-associated/Transposase DDE domain